MNEFLKLNVIISFAATLGFIIHMAPNWRFPRIRLLLIVLGIYFTWNLWVLSTMLVSVFELKVFFTKIRQVLNPFLSPLWWTIVHKVFYPDFWQRHRRLLALLYVIPGISSILTMFSLFGVESAEKLMAFGFAGPDAASGLLYYQSGPWLKLQFLYAGIMLLLLTATYLVNVFNKDPLKVKYAYIFLAATVFVVPLEIYASLSKSSLDKQLMAGSSWVFIGVILLGMSRYEFFNIRLSSLRKILDQIPSPVLVWNHHGVLWEANEAAARLFSFSSKELGEGSLLREVRQKLDAVDVFEIEGREFEVHRRDYAYVLSEVSEINEVNRTLKAVNKDLLGVNRDIHRVQKTLAHDLAHAVQQISVQIDNVPEGTGREQLRVSSQSASEILSSTLSWIKGQSVAVDANEVLQKTLRQVQYGLQGRELRLKLPSGALLVRGEEFLVQTVFRNIISNAIKHSAGECSVEIELKSESHRVVFCCRDQGNGFAKGAVSGTGLALVQEALADLGATMNVHSSNQGATVEVFFIQAKESGS